MSSEKSLTPQIRFKGFTEAWEQRKLGDYLLLSTEKNTNLQYGIEDVLSVSWTAGVVNQIEFQGRSFAGSNLSGYDVAHHECVIYTKSPLKDEPFGIIKTNYLTSGIVSQLYAVYRTNSLGNPAFVETYFSQTARLNNYLRPLVNKGAKNTMNISDEEALKGGVIFPLLEEQDSISSLFLLIDRLITLHQRKLDAIKKIKSALLEKMFPKDGSDIPEIRFTGFTEAWEQRKLGDYGLVQMCRRIYKDQTSEIGDVPFFKIGTFGSQPDAFISRSLFQDYRKQYPFPSVGTPLISAAGSIGRTVIYQGEEAYFQDSNIVWLDNNEKLNNVFLNSLYKKIDWKLEGSTIKRLYNKDILNAEVCVPSTLEQCQVGSFFAHLDSLITLHQRKLDALKKIKSALLEKMFV